MSQPNDSLEHDDDHGPQLARDLEVFRRRVHRRALLRGLVGVSVGVVTARLAGCVSSASDLALQNEDGTCNEIPSETGGPFPGDGSNGKNALTLDGIVRSDLRSSIGGDTAPGVLMTLTLTLLDGACAPLAGKAIYVWHCDQNGEYSMYDTPDETWLRGVQVTDDDGKVRFTTIFPGCYSGRWPHIHFEIYPSKEAATTSTNALATSQLALPDAACSAAYEADGYDDSVANLAKNSIETDNVFSDGVGRQLASVEGSIDEGFTAALTFTVDI